MRAKLLFRPLIITSVVILGLFMLAKFLIPVNKIRYKDTWMDSPKTHDMALDHPEFLVSKRWPHPTAQQLASPVVIAVHGYSASTFEWWEFRDYAEAKGIPVSLVLLGGHGRNLDAFKHSSSEDWGQPILDEFRALAAKGYTNISIAASSAGCALVLNELSTHALDAPKAPLTHLFFIDPFVIPGNKLLRFVDILGPILGSLPPKPDRSELYREHWYNNDPYHAIKELNKLSLKLTNELNHKITLPSGVHLHIFKSDGDEVAPLENAPFIAQHIQSPPNTSVTVTIVHSPYHVYTQLSARESVKPEERKLQQSTFAQIISEMAKVPSSAEKRSLAPQ